MRLPVAILLAASAAPLAAQAPAPAPSSTLSLSEEERQDLLDHNTEDSARAAQAGLAGSPSLDRQIHGQISAMVGTNGARGIAGTAAIPLGNNAGAVVSFESSRFGRYR